MPASMRLGILNDLPLPQGSSVPSDTERWLSFAVEELANAGRLDRSVEFVHAGGSGLPSGTAAAVERAYTSLVEQDVLLIVGPAIGDNALVATPLAERYCVPTINWAGAERARGEYMFHLQVGSHEYDLGRLVAEALARAPELTREGLKHGLERVKWLPAAEGYDGTLLGFGIRDRGALHGRYLVLRKWVGGHSVEVAR
jgi:hypothetical protein